MRKILRDRERSILNHCHSSEGWNPDLQKSLHFPFAGFWLSPEWYDCNLTPLRSSAYNNGYYFGVGNLTEGNCQHGISPP
jgi:hypothetical protein